MPSCLAQRAGKGSVGPKQALKGLVLGFSSRFHRPLPSLTPTRECPIRLPICPQGQLAAA